MRIIGCNFNENNSGIIEQCLNTICSPADTLHLQSDLDKVSSWSRRWELFFNENKFVHIHFCSTNPDCTTIYKVNDKVIDCKTQYKDLGILYSYNLTWTEHYDHILVKAYNTLGLLRRTFKTNIVLASKKTALYITSAFTHILQLAVTGAYFKKKLQINRCIMRNHPYVIVSRVYQTLSC